MEKYVNVYLSNNIHKSSGIYDSSVFQDSFMLKNQRKGQIRYYFGHMIMIKK